MIIKYHGNLFESTADILCHQVNCQGVMETGISKNMKIKMGTSNYRIYQNNCEKYNAQLMGQIYICRNISFSKDKTQYIANLFAQKEKSRYTPQTNYYSFEKCLKKLKKTCEENPNIQSIAFPYGIGCGHSGGDWNKIYSLIEKYFGHKNPIICEIWQIND